VDTKKGISFIYTSVNTVVYMHFLNMRDIILVGDNIVMLLS